MRISILTAEDIVRHDTVTRIVRAYESYEKEKFSKVGRENIGDNNNP